MERTTVPSSNIASAGYDEGSQTLEIEFTNGNIYQYYNVEAHLYEEFKSATPKGQFLNAYIRNSYPYSRVG